MIARPIALLLAGALVAAPTAAADTSSVPAPFPSVKVAGSVNALLADGDTAYVGGIFNALGPRPAPFAAVSATDGSFVRNWPGIVDWGAPPDTDGSILPASGEAVAADGAGGWYFGGEFQRAEGTSIANLAHLRADGTVDPGFGPNSNGVVTALVLHDGVLWAAGTFTRIGGRSITGLAALDPATGAVLGRFPHGMDGTVASLSLDAGRIYAVGEFSRAGGDAHPRIAAIDADDGTVLDWLGALPEGTASRVSARDGVVYVTGRMHGKFEDERIGAVALSAANGGRLGLDFGIYEGGEVLATPDAVVIGGEYKDDSSVHAFAPGSANRLPWFAGATQEPTALELTPGRLLISGLGGGVAGYDPRTGAQDGFTTATGAAAHDIAVGGGAIAVAGEQIPGVPGVARRNLAAIDLGTGAVTSVAPDPGGVRLGFPTVYGSVAALAKGGDVLFMGGDFFEASGREENGLAGVDVRTGAPVDLPDVGGKVEALAVSGSRLFVGGRFTKLGDVTVRNFGVVDLTTGQAMSGPQFDDEVRALGVSAGILHVGGAFYRVDGVARRGLASFDADTLAPAAAFAAQPDGRVDSIVPDGAGGIWIGGDLRRIGAATIGGVAHVREDGSVDPDVPVADDEVFSVSVGDDQLYFGGGFDHVDGEPREGLASVRLADRALTAFRPHLDPGVRAVAAAPGGVIAAGSFQMTELTSVPSLARFGKAAAVAPPVATSSPRVFGGTFPGAGQRFEGLEWDGAPTFVQTRWLRCDGDGANCAEIDDDGAIATVRQGDGGHRFRVEAVAWNDGGASAPVLSAPGPLLADHGPVVVVGPQLWGTPVVGAALTVDEGVYDPAPTGYVSYEWQRCNPSGCSAIPGAAGKPVHVVGAAEAGYHIRVLARPGYAPDGTPSPASNELGPIVTAAAGSPPAAGTPTLERSGDLLLASKPADAAPATTHRFGWLHCDAAGDACVEIAGTARAHRLEDADAGHTLRVFTIAFDAGGTSGRGVSAPSTLIEGDPAPTPTPVATATPTPVATATPTPVATATPTPEPEATPYADADPVAPIHISASMPAADATPAPVMVRVIADRAARSRGVAVRVKSPDAQRVPIALRFAGDSRVIGRATVALRAGVARTVRIRVSGSARTRLRRGARAVVARAGTVTSASVTLGPWSSRAM